MWVRCLLPSLLASQALCLFSSCEEQHGRSPDWNEIRVDKWSFNTLSSPGFKADFGTNAMNGDDDIDHIIKYACTVFAQLMCGFFLSHCRIDGKIVIWSLKLLVERWMPSSYRKLACRCMNFLTRRLSKALGKAPNRRKSGWVYHIVRFQTVTDWETSRFQGSSLDTVMCFFKIGWKYCGLFPNLSSSGTSGGLLSSDATKPLSPVNNPTAEAPNALVVNHLIPSVLARSASIQWNIKGHTQETKFLSYSFRAV